MACLEASLSHNWMYGVVSNGWNRTGAMMAVQASGTWMDAREPVNCCSNCGGMCPLATSGVWPAGKTTIPHPLERSLWACWMSSSVSSEHRLFWPRMVQKASV